MSQKLTSPLTSFPDLSNVSRYVWEALESWPTKKSHIFAHVKRERVRVTNANVHV